MQMIFLYLFFRLFLLGFNSWVAFATNLLYKAQHYSIAYTHYTVYYIAMARGGERERQSVKKWLQKSYTRVGVILPLLPEENSPIILYVLLLQLQLNVKQLKANAINHQLKHIIKVHMYPYSILYFGSLKLRCCTVKLEVLFVVKGKVSQC